MAADILKLQLGPWTTWTWIFFTTLVYVDIMAIRQKFCGSVCPYARFQSAFFDEKTLTIEFDRSQAQQCLGCEACVRVCPSGIDIRNGLQVECINCAECIDACGGMMEARNKAPLVHYARGSAASQGPRWGVAGLSVAFGIIAMLFAYQSYVRVPMEFWVFREEPQPMEQVANKGSMINVYSLIVENRSLKPEIYKLSLSGLKDAELHIGQNPIILPPNSTVRMKLYVIALRKNLTYHTSRIRFVLEDIASHEVRKEQESSFVYPERSEKGWEI